MAKDSVAIVIPYYKHAFFDELLCALNAQDDKNFTIYVGDDCSPVPPLDIIWKFKATLDIRYTRYPSRLGHKCLASHWNRCLSLCQGEEWVWVIPDDDLPDKNCVSTFRNVLHSCWMVPCSVAVFPVATIDPRGKLLSRPIFIGGIAKESNYDFYIRQLSGLAQGSSLGENIFHLDTLLSVGGFVPFPKAWGSDHATINLVASINGIQWLPRSTFYFRQSRINISSQKDDGSIKMFAKLLYAIWLRRNQRRLFGERDLDYFFRLIYFKGEHYFLSEWRFSVFSLLWLACLRFVCIPRECPAKVITVCISLIRNGSRL